MGQARNPSTQRDHTLCVIRALVPTFGRATTACVSSPRDWAVSMGSHMQQDMGISQAPPHLGASVSFVSNRSRHKTTIQKKGSDLPPEILVLGTCFNASLTPRRAQDVFLHRMILKLQLCLVSEIFPNDKFVWHWCGVVSQLIRK